MSRRKERARKSGTVFEFKVFTDGTVKLVTRDVTTGETHDAIVRRGGRMRTLEPEGLSSKEYCHYCYRHFNDKDGHPLLDTTHTERNCPWQLPPYY